MIRYSHDKPPSLTRSEELGFKTFKGLYDLNIIACRNMIERPNVFQDTLHVVYFDGKWIEHVFSCTTHAGLYYLNNPTRKSGCAVLKHDHQYRSSFKIGMRSSGYKCLIPCADIPVWRDANMDDIVQYGGSDYDSSGIQIHRANSTDTTVNIGKYSAGCVVIQSGFDMFMNLCEKQVESKKGSKFSLTILRGIYL